MTQQDIKTPLDQALEWCIRLQDAGVSEAELKAFDEWLARSRAHHEAWQRAQQVWSTSRTVADAFVESQRAKPKPRRLFQWMGWATAALIILTVGRMNISPSIWADYRTSVAQTRIWNLEDGSSIQLAPQTALDVKFNAGERRVLLYQGEAWFKVAANPSRPFIVEASDGSTRALGTAFDVKIKDDSVAVTVTEHAVRVEQHGQQVDVQQGQTLRYDRTGISQPLAINLNQQLAWRQQRLVFKGAPLSEVIDQLQPHSSSRLLIADDALDSLSVTAAFDAQQPMAALQSLAVILPIQVTTFGPWLTLIRADVKKIRE